MGIYGCYAGQRNHALFIVLVVGFAISEASFVVCASQCEFRSACFTFYFLYCRIFSTNVRKVCIHLNQELAEQIFKFHFTWGGNLETPCYHVVEVLKHNYSRGTLKQKRLYSTYAHYFWTMKGMIFFSYRNMGLSLMRNSTCSMQVCNYNLFCSFPVYIFFSNNLTFFLIGLQLQPSLGPQQKLERRYVIFLQLLPVHTLG